MTEYYKLVIDKTARPMGNNKEWSRYDQEIKYFKSIEEAKKYVKDQYFYCKTKYKTFNDNEEGQTGWIYAFKSDPASYDDCKHYEQHWINLFRIHSKPCLF
ncbi:MAG: hypothetical protein WC549_00385 [Actinomycetota bacterium]